jgi:hypothetical protein
MELGEREKRKENDNSSAILHTIRCEGGGYEAMH